jgi:hypothetical protein
MIWEQLLNLNFLSAIQEGVGDNYCLVIFISAFIRSAGTGVDTVPG